MGLRAAAATGTWMGTGPSAATAWTCSRSPRRTAWAACGRSACGTTTKVCGGARGCPSGTPPAPFSLTHRPSPAGLSPAWFLQHVIVRDLQTACSTFFLVNDWLSVETEANGGLVEKEVLAASKGLGPSLPGLAEGWPVPLAS